jgi:hypothetical protein
MVVACSLPSAAAEAQGPGDRPRPSGGASPTLDAGHWAVRAAWRAEALGLAPGFLPAQRSAPREAVAAALEAASRDARGTVHETIADGWWARFLEEYGTQPAGAALRPGPVAAAVGFATLRGRVSPGRGIYALREDASPVADLTTPTGSVRGDVSLGGRVLLDAVATADRDGARADRWEVAVRAGPLAASLGRAEVGYGPGRTGGIVLSTQPLLRVELATPEPVRLPSFAGALGSVTLHTFASRLGGPRHPERPWLWGGRLAVAPSTRFSVGINRAAIFGGGDRPVTPRRVAGMLAGVLSDDFENQIVSVDARWRLPTEGLLAAAAYLEWGAEDAAGAWHRQPGRTLGVLFPAVPGMPAIAAGVERTSFGPCCAHGSWYTHYVFTGNWARGDALLAHPLGGEGTEWAVYLEAEAGARARLDGRFFVRDRRGETADVPGTGNLLAPLALGRSAGGELRALVRLHRRLGLEARLYRDAGGTLREHHAELDLTYRLR